MSKYMRKDTLFTDVVPWWARWVKGRKGKGEELPRVLTMVKTTPLDIASRR